MPRITSHGRATKSKRRGLPAIGTVTTTGREAARASTEAHGRRVEALIFLAYFALFMGYNLSVREPEPLHWLSLVLVLSAVAYVYRRRTRSEHLGAVLSSVGLRRGNLVRGLPFALLVGLALGGLQVLVSDRRSEIWAIISSGRVLISLPLVIAFLLVTAGFTEEFFFRGVLQTRLASWLGAEIWGLLIAAALFGLYHLPYVYFGAGSQLRGDLLGALLECGYDALAGIVIGLVFWRARQNLLAAVTVHVLIDALPAMTMVHISLKL